MRKKSSSNNKISERPQAVTMVNSLFASKGTELALEYGRSRIQFEEFQMRTRIQRTRIRFEIGGNEQ